MDATLREELKAFIAELARASGELIMRYWNDGNVQVDRKADATPVTEADRGAERIMREMINQRYPAHGIIAEEFGNEREDADFVWVLDPIDGTKSFVGHVPLFGTLIGLLHKGEPVIGCIHQPVLGELLIGDNETATLNGKPVHVRDCEKLEAAVICTTDPELFNPAKGIPGLSRLADAALLTRSWGDCYGYLLVATGRIDLMLDPVMEPWDVLPLIAIIRGAGGVITTWDGGDPAKGRSAVAAGPGIHPIIIDILDGHG